MELYKEFELCLHFDNSEIQEHLINSLKSKYPELTAIDFYKGDKEPIERSSDRMKHIVFFPERSDILKRDFFGVFFSYGRKVSILIYDREFVFIDDTMKKFIGCQETDGYAVYQGLLRNKTHKEILEMIKVFIELCIDAEDLRIEEKEISEFDTKNRIYKTAIFPDWEAAHPYCYYNVYLKKQKSAPSVQFENITFHIVESF